MTKTINRKEGVRYEEVKNKQPQNVANEISDTSN